MPILPIEWEIDPEMVDLLIKKEQEEQNNAQERPFLQLPMPNPPNLPEFAPKNDEKDDNDGVIIIDLQTTYTMQKLLKEWKNYLNEVKGNWEYRIMLRLDGEASLYGDLFEKIRAIPGVTIVKTEEKQQKISAKQKGAVVSIKVIVKGASIPDYTLFLKRELDKLADDKGARILGVKLVASPKKLK